MTGRRITLLTIALPRRYTREGSGKAGAAGQFHVVDGELTIV